MEHGILLIMLSINHITFSVVVTECLGENKVCTHKQQMHPKFTK